MPDLDPKIMRVNARAELDFLNRGCVLMLLGFLFLLGEFVAELAEIHDATDGRHGIGRNLHQINASLSGKQQRIVQGHHAELLSVKADDPDFAGTDFPVDPDERGG